MACPARVEHVIPVLRRILPGHRIIPGHCFTPGQCIVNIHCITLSHHIPPIHTGILGSGVSPGIAGWMWGDQVLQWQRRDKKLLLVAPDLRNEGKTGTAVSDAVRRTYTDRIIKTVDIKTMKDGNPVIDLGDLFKKDFANIGRVYGGSLDSSLAKWIKVKCFQQNIVLTVESPYKGKVLIKAHVSRRVAPGTVFAPYNFAGQIFGKKYTERYPERMVPYAVGATINVVSNYGYDRVTQMQETKVGLCKVYKA